MDSDCKSKDQWKLFSLTDFVLDFPLRLCRHNRDYMYATYNYAGRAIRGRCRVENMSRSELGVFHVFLEFLFGLAWQPRFINSLNQITHTIIVIFPACFARIAATPTTPLASVWRLATISSRSKRLAASSILLFLLALGHILILWSQQLDFFLFEIRGFLSLICHGGEGRTGWSRYGISKPETLLSSLPFTIISNSTVRISDTSCVTFSHSLPPPFLDPLFFYPTQIQPSNPAHD